MNPTVGRVVHYFPGPSDKIAEGYPAGPLAALVACVWNPGTVNLSVLAPNGEWTPRTSVRFAQPNEAVANDWAYATWMPYQVGQAAKTEALQAELDSKFPTRAGEEIKPGRLTPDLKQEPHRGGGASHQ